MSAASKSIVVTDPGDRLLKPRDAVVRDCIELKIEKRWQAGHSLFALAKRHGIPKSMVSTAAAEADRYLRIVLEPEVTRRHLLVKLRSIVEQDDGDRVPAIGMIAKMAGVLEAPSVDDGPRTPSDRIARLREALRDPDDELLEALRAEKQAIWSLLFSPGKSPPSKRRSMSGPMTRQPNSP